MNINFLPVNQNQQGPVDPEAILRRQELAKALRERAGAQRNIEHPLQGVAQLSDALVGGLVGQRAEQERAANSQFLAEALSGATGGQSLSPEKMEQLFVLNPELGMKLMQMEEQRAAAAAAANAPITINNQRIDPRTGEVLGDYRDPQAPAGPDIISIFDQKTGREQKGYLDENRNFVPVGGTEAPTADGEGMDAFGFPVTSAISQKIKAFQLQGFDDQTAFGLASGRFDVSLNPATGERVIIDTATKQIVPLKQPVYEEQPQAGQGGDRAGGQPVAENAAGGTLWDMAGDATGLGSATANMLANTVGQVPGTIGEMVEFPEQVQAQQEFDLFSRDLIRALSLNPRFPVAEQQRIEDLVPRGVAIAPGTLKTALKALDGELARIEAEMTAAIADPRAPLEQRQADTQTLRGVKAARQRLGIPGEDRQSQPDQNARPDLVDKYGLTPRGQ